MQNEAARTALIPIVGQSDLKVVAAGIFDLLTIDRRPELAAIHAALLVLFPCGKLPESGDATTTTTGAEALFKAAYALAGAARLLAHGRMQEEPEKFAVVDEFLK